MTNTEIPEEAVTTSAQALYDHQWSGTPTEGQFVSQRLDYSEEEARIVLEAALPALRKQWAEEVATFAEEAADDLELPVMPEWLDQRSWFKGQLHALAARVREYGETTP